MAIPDRRPMARYTGAGGHGAWLKREFSELKGSGALPGVELEYGERREYGSSSMRFG